MLPMLFETNGHYYYSNVIRSLYLLCMQVWYKAGCMGSWCDMLHTSLWNNAIWKVCTSNIQPTKSPYCGMAYTAIVRKQLCPTSNEATILSCLHSGTKFQMKLR